jgi:hypothetical protein
MMPMTSAPSAFAIAAPAEPTSGPGDRDPTVLEIANSSKSFEGSRARET